MFEHMQATTQIIHWWVLIQLASREHRTEGQENSWKKYLSCRSACCWESPRSLMVSDGLIWVTYQKVPMSQSGPSLCWLSANCISSRLTTQYSIPLCIPWFVWVCGSAILAQTHPEIELEFSTPQIPRVWLRDDFDFPNFQKTSGTPTLPM